MSNYRSEKNLCPSTGNINELENVNSLRAEADMIELSPAAMLALVDMILGFQEGRQLPS